MQLLFEKWWKKNVEKGSGEEKEISDFVINILMNIYVLFSTLHVCEHDNEK